MRKDSSQKTLSPCEAIIHVFRGLKFGDALVTERVTALAQAIAMMEVPTDHRWALKETLEEAKRQLEQLKMREAARRNRAIHLALEAVGEAMAAVKMRPIEESRPRVRRSKKRVPRLRKSSRPNPGDEYRVGHI